MATIVPKFKVGEKVYDLSDETYETIGWVRAIITRQYETTYLVAVKGCEAEYHAQEITNEKQL